MAYDIGDIVRVTAYFTIDGVATDPSSGPTCKYKDPSAVVVTKTHPGDAEVVKDATGRYHLDVTIDESGTWFYLWAGTGTAQASEEGNFDVAITEFP
ncbi:MAG: hypothetical protein GQ524_11705 [Anaerolineales bacterium]|nr:hypothetical protein [Anaerolineales bacterium]